MAFITFEVPKELLIRALMSAESDKNKQLAADIRAVLDGRYEAESDMEQARRRAGGSALMSTNAGGLY
jgi:hypothetical protein